MKIEMEQQIEQLTLLYYQAVRQEQLIKGIEIAMQVSNERIKLYERKLEIGAGSNVELLQAKLDHNAQKSNLLSQKSLLNEFKINLLNVLKMDATSSIEVDTIFEFESSRTIEEIKQKIEQSNQSVMFANRNILVQEQALKELQSLHLPVVGLTSSYNFARSENAAGFALLNQNLGYNVGLNFSWNIFNGYTTKNQIKVSNYTLQNSKLESYKVKLSLNNTAVATFQRMSNDQEILTLEEDNIKLAQEALDISLERLKLGLGNYLEIKESENTYEASITRLVNARYNLKQSETSLKKLMGNLVNSGN